MLNTPLYPNLVLMLTLDLFRGTIALQMRIFLPSTMDSHVPQSPCQRAEQNTRGVRAGQILTTGGVGSLAPALIKKTTGN